MTEAEWQASEDPTAMIRHLTHERIIPEDAHGWDQERKVPLVSDRKLRLFACACCQRVPARGPDLASLRSAEAFADGLTTDTMRHIAWNHAVNSAASHAFRHLCAHTVNHESQLRRALASWDGDQAEGRRVFAHLLRDIVGNPFRPVVLSWQHDGGRPAEGVAVSGRLVRRMDHSPHLYEWADRRPWLTPTVVSLAQTAYDGRDPVTGHMDPLTLAAVADALEEAGCDSVDLLQHLRSPGPHVRGCWAVDLLLGKEYS